MFFLSDKLVKKYPNLYNYKPGIEFLARLFFISLILILVKKIYWLISDGYGYINYPFIGKASPIEFVRNVLLQSTKSVLELFHFQPSVHGWVVGIPGGGVRIETPCLGINVCFVFMALVIAYPGIRNGWFKFLYAIGGIVVIQLLNVGRMVAMIFVVKNKYQLPIEHHDLFNMMIYSVVILLFYYFTILSAVPPTVRTTT